MSIKQIAEQFAFLQDWGFKEPVMQVDEKKGITYILFGGDGREVRISLQHRWPTVQLIEWEAAGTEQSPKLVELEPDLTRYPSLAHPQRGSWFKRVLGLSRDERSEREHEQAATDLANRLQKEYPDFRPISEGAV